MELSYQENYWDSPEMKSEFMSFLLEIHGLDLALWNKFGYWDNKYRPFSFFSGNSLVSNVCVYSMDMTIQGKQCQVAQISGVGTLPEYRKRGLSQELTQKAMDWAQANHDFFYLFADEEAYRFYEKCGFRPEDEYKSTVSVSGMVPKPGAVKLDINDANHREQIYALASTREPVSDLLGVSNKRLFMFWCLYFLGEHIYHIPQLDVLVLYQREGELLTILDVVGSKIPAFSEFYPYICDENDRTAEFLFMVDKMKLENCDQVQTDGNGTHILGNFPLNNTQFIFPLTAQA